MTAGGGGQGLGKMLQGLQDGGFMAFHSTTFESGQPASKKVTEDQWPLQIWCAALVPVGPPCSLRSSVKGLSFLRGDVSWGGLVPKML